jgi:DNA-directed RNA polymerase specialized sigma24 family protein
VVALQAAEPPFTVAEIADVLDVSERQVWRLMSRVRSYRARAAGRV